MNYDPLKDDPDAIYPVARYITGEIMANCANPATLLTREIVAMWNSLSPAGISFMSALSWCSQNAAATAAAPALSGAYAQALGWFALKVRPGGPWDHKPRIRNSFGTWHKYKAHEYNYDIWSNIHYGYLGAFIGFGEGLLKGGAGLVQTPTTEEREAGGYFCVMASRLCAHISGGRTLRECDDPMDQLSISIGVELYRAFPTPGRALCAFMLAAVVNSNWLASHKRIYDPYRHNSNYTRRASNYVFNRQGGAL